MSVKACTNKELTEGSVHYINSIERGKILPQKKKPFKKILNFALCATIGVGIIYVIYPIISGIFRSFEQVIVGIF